MTKNKNDSTMPGQQFLPFFPEADPPSYQIHSQIKDVISEALKKSRFSRHQVAARMSEVLDSDITKSQLDSWSAESKEFHRFPAEYVPAFCYASEETSLLRVIVGPVRGVQLIVDQDAIKLQIAKLDDELKKMKDEKKFLERRLGK